jgi:caspase domain-containing protein
MRYRCSAWLSLTEFEMFQLVIATFLGVLIVTASSFPAFAEKRFALLIGNKNYGPQVGTLKNPYKDIALIDKALQQVGFSVVSKKDLGRTGMKREISEFVNRLSNAGPEYSPKAGQPVVDRVL